MSELVPALVLGGVGMQALGMYQQGQAASAQAKAQQSIADYNARVAEQEARAVEQATAYRQRQMAKEAGRYGSTLRATIGTSGAVPSEGTPLLVQATQAAESEMDNLLAGYEGLVKARRARSEAAVARMQGQAYGAAARNYGTAGLIGAGSTLLTGFGSYFPRSAGY